MKDLFSKIACPFGRNRTSLSPRSHLPFQKIAYAIFHYHFSAIPEWLRPIPVWTIDN